jgi:hypothetical protein
MHERLLVCCLLLAGCAPKKGALTPEGYQSGKHDLKVAVHSEGALMGSNWRLDNYFQDGDGWYPKTGAEYRATYELDHDGDGRYETKAKEYIFELRFVHRGHDGVIFLRTVPQSTDQKDKRLDVLMDRYIGGIAGSGYSVVTFGDTPRVVEKRFAATIAEEGKGTIGGLSAQTAIVDIKNLDQLEVDPDTKGSRLEIILAHTNFVFHSNPRYEEETAFPVLLVAGYWNRADEFEESLPEFHEFLNRIMIGWQQGATISYPEKAEPSETEPSSARVAAGSSAQEPEPPPEPAPTEGGEQAITPAP